MIPSDNRMLYELRHYTCRPGSMAEQHDIYQRLGMEPQVRILGAPVMFATAEVGKLGSYVHIWQYRDLADRQEKRRQLYAEPAFQEYRARFLATGNMVEMENMLLTGVNFIRPLALA